VLDRSREILNQLEQQELEIKREGGRSVPQQSNKIDSGPQMSLFISEPDPAMQEIWDAVRSVNPNDITPLDALLLLSRLHQKTSDS